DAASRLSPEPAAAEAPCLAGFSRDQKGDGDVAPRSAIGNGRHSMANAIEHVHWPNAPDMWMPSAPAITVNGGPTVYLAGPTAAPAGGPAGPGSRTTWARPRAWAPLGRDRAGAGRGGRGRGTPGRAPRRTAPPSPSPAPRLAGSPPCAPRRRTPRPSRSS